MTDTMEQTDSAAAARPVRRSLGRLLGDNVAIQPLDGLEMRASGIITMGAVETKGRLKMGRVLKVGPGKWYRDKFIAVGVEPGECVLYREFLEDEKAATVGEQTFFIVEEGMIEGVVNEEEV